MKMCRSSRKCIDSVNGKFKPRGGWNKEWADKVHEEGDIEIYDKGEKEWDDITGLELNRTLVKKAKDLEMEFFRKWEYTKWWMRMSRSSLEGRSSISSGST